MDFQYWAPLHPIWQRVERGIIESLNGLLRDEYLNARELVSIYNVRGTLNE
jgi:hypothetical protein